MVVSLTEVRLMCVPSRAWIVSTSTVLLCILLHLLHREFTSHLSQYQMFIHITSNHDESASVTPKIGKSTSIATQDKPSAKYRQVPCPARTRLNSYLLPPPAVPPLPPRPPRLLPRHPLLPPRGLPYEFVNSRGAASGSHSSCPTPPPSSPACAGFQ